MDKNIMPILAGLGRLGCARMVQMAMVPHEDDRLEYELADDDGSEQRVA